MDTTCNRSETISLNGMTKQALDHRIRILLVDELGLFRASLAHFLASEPDFDVVGECCTAAEALGLLRVQHQTSFCWILKSVPNAGRTSCVPPGEPTIKGIS